MSSKAQRGACLAPPYRDGLRRPKAARGAPSCACFLKALVCVVCPAMTMFAAEHINISVCNLGDVPDKVVAHAESVVAAVFSPLRIEVGWADCEGSGPGLNILLRLRREGPLGAERADSLDVMGMAFTAAGVAGSRADAYYGAIEGFARRHHADPAEVLGYVVVHELGHLLLGPGHSSGSIMTASWNDKTLEAASHRWLTFNQSQRASIHRELQVWTLLAGS